MNQSSVETVAVPGARLYAIVRGSGPLVQVLQGGDGDATGADGMVEHLVDHFTVVTYDRRGLSHSRIDDGVPPPSLETHSDDAHHLLAALTREPAFVVGFSFGALLGLDLVTRYPDQVRLLVAHEPPAFALLPEPERSEALRSQAVMDETFRRGGLEGAMRAMRAAMPNVDFADREPDVVLPQGAPTPQRAANLESFLRHDAPAAHRYQLDVPALTAMASRIVPAAGRGSRDLSTHHAARALAALLGRELVEFPGGHNGFLLHPKGFAARLQEIFAPTDAL